MRSTIRASSLMAVALGLAAASGLAAATGSSIKFPRARGPQKPDPEREASAEAKRQRKQRKRLANAAGTTEQAKEQKT